jgi:hypothetical protein
MSAEGHGEQERQNTHQRCSGERLEPTANLNASKPARSSQASHSVSQKAARQAQMPEESYNRAVTQTIMYVHNQHHTVHTGHAPCSEK